MLAHQRQVRILAELRRTGAVRVSDLTEMLDVSDMTIRRDLENLVASGIARKVHGGAVLAGQVAHEPGFAVKSQLEQSAKHAIAARAASLIQPGAAIALSAGTTTWAMAPLVVTIPGLTVVTNSTTVADAIATLDPTNQISVVLTGGVRTPSAALVGPVADRAIATMHVDQLFLGVHGMDERIGFTTPNLAEAATNRALIACAREVIVVADSSKWGVVGLADIAPLTAAHVVVTDDRLPRSAARILSEHVPQLIETRDEAA
ncbi:MAG TPA: DeoR/GlpR family DNA-binding transcription regulator [Micromonosporaceae bacterium]|jgi:DeoR/GlpR family transcriptional regulator of sugar metabolism|nr:DeoR/GlpR family DNA-binding transcription regulator [Micromonosporaceae bacterium]